MTIRRLMMALAIGVLFSAGLVLFNNAALQIPGHLLMLVMVSAAGLAVVSGVFEVRSWRTPTPEEPPVAKMPVMPKSPVEKALNAMDSAQDMSSRTERKVRIRIDTEDTRND